MQPGGERGETTEIITVSEKDIRDDYYPWWYEKMCRKYGKEKVDSTYSFEECLADWSVDNGAWESNDMTDYKAMWENTVEEVNWLTDQNKRLKGSSKENPTLRDQFAMAALTGLLANPNNTYGDKVKKAYEAADQMMLFRI